MNTTNEEFEVPEAYYHCKKHGMIRFGYTATDDGSYLIIMVRDTESKNKDYCYCCPLCVNELLLKEIASKKLEVLDYVNGKTLETSSNRYAIEGDI